MEGSAVTGDLINVMRATKPSNGEKQGPLLRNVSLALRVNAIFCRHTSAASLKQTFPIHRGFLQPLHFLNGTFLTSRAVWEAGDWIYPAESF